MAQVVLADEINRATPEDPVGPPRGDGGAPGDGRRHDLRDARPVPRHRHPEPDRVRGHVRPAGGPARPVHAPDPARLPPADRGGRDPRRAEAAPPARGARGRLLGRRAARACRTRSATSTSTRRSREYIVRLVDAHPRPPRRLPRRVAARLDRAVPGRPGAGRPARPRLRDPRRHQGARRAGPRPSADHQDQLVDPRRPGRRTSSASCSTARRSTASARPAARTRLRGRPADRARRARAPEHRPTRTSGTDRR